MDFFTLVPTSSHNVDAKLKYKVPNSFRVEVEDFVHEFYSACGYTAPIGSESASRFYAKTSFAENCNDRTGHDILLKLLCERNLLFERDFDILGQRTWEDYRLNCKFADEWDGTTSDLMNAALEQTIDECKPSTAFEEYLKAAVERVKSKKLNVKRARGYALSFAAEFINDAQDVDRFQHIIWPRFISNWFYLLWRRDIKVDYKREINENHWMALSETKERLQSLKNIWDAALDAWKTLRKDKQEAQFDVSQSQCEKFLKKYGVKQDKNTEYARKMYRNAQNIRGTAGALLQAIEQCLKIPRHDLWMRLVWLVRIREYFVPDELCGTEINRLCQEIYGSKHGPALSFFRELNQKNLGEILVLQDAVQCIKLPEEPRWKWLTILQLGMQIAEYLDGCFSSGKEYLAITDPCLLQSNVIEHYKDDCATQYRELVTCVGKDQKRLKAYQDIWDDPWHTIEERVDFLKRWIRYVRKLIPVGDPDIWSDYTPVRLSQGEKRDAAIKRRIPQLQLLLFENALQDCICNQAQMKLWDLLVAQLASC